MTKKTGPQHSFAAYDYKTLIEALKTFSGDFQSPMFNRSLNMTYALVTATASVDFPFAVNGSGSELDLAISFAWEDMHIAFAGHGYPIYTGAVLEMFYSIDPKDWDKFSDALSTGMATAYGNTAREGEERILRYLSALYEKPPIRSPQDLTGKVFHAPFYGGSLDAYFLAQGTSRESLQAMIELHVRSLQRQNRDKTLGGERQTAPRAPPKPPGKKSPTAATPKEMGQVLTFPPRPPKK